MPAYLISYRNEDNGQFVAETVFMRNLTAAKRSATATALDITHSITISDVGDKLLSTKKDGKWINL